MYDIKETYEQYLLGIANPKPCINLYRALCMEVEMQYNALPSDLWVDYSRKSYNSAALMFYDIKENRQLIINTDGCEFVEEHPLAVENKTYGVSFNLMLRAVHDFYGHYLSGSNFSWTGECTAFDHHSKMFSRKLRGILKGEVLGQAAYVLTTGEFISPQPMVNMED